MTTSIMTLINADDRRRDVRGRVRERELPYYRGSVRPFFSLSLSPSLSGSSCAMCFIDDARFRDRRAWARVSCSRRLLLLLRERDCGRFLFRVLGGNKKFIIDEGLLIDWYIVSLTCE